MVLIVDSQHITFVVLQEQFPLETIRCSAARNHLFRPHYLGATWAGVNRLMSLLPLALEPQSTVGCAPSTSESLLMSTVCECALSTNDPIYKYDFSPSTLGSTPCATHKWRFHCSLELFPHLSLITSAPFSGQSQV